jgi:hypothetical protein
MRFRLNALLTVAFLLAANSALAQRTDELVLYNGNTITGEVKSLQQGKLKFKTDHAGTIYLEWDFINSVTSTNFFEVENQLGDHYYGMLAPGPEDKKLTVIGPTETVFLDMDRVVTIMPIKQTFWGRIDGSLNLGFSFTSADNILQYSIESDATYREQKYSSSIKLSSIQTRFQTEQDEDTSVTFRDNLDFTFTRYRKNRYFAAGTLTFTRSSELGIDFRTELGWVYGRRFKQTNKSNLQAAAGLTVSRETPIGDDDPSSIFLSAAILGRYHFFLYNYPKTDLLIELAVLPGISPARWRGGGKPRLRGGPLRRLDVLMAWVLGTRDRRRNDALFPLVFFRALPRSGRMWRRDASGRAGRGLRTSRRARDLHGELSVGVFC